MSPILVFFVALVVVLMVGIAILASIGSFLILCMMSPMDERGTTTPPNKDIWGAAGELPPRYPNKNIWG